MNKENSFNCAPDDVDLLTSIQNENDHILDIVM